MADLNSIQSFTSPSFNIEPVVKRNPQNNQSMGLQDLINVGRSALAMKKEQELYQPSVEKGIAESKQQVLAAEKAGVDLNQYYANAARGVYGGFLNDPDFINGSQESMIKKIESAQRYLKEDLKIPSHDSGMNAELLNIAKKDPKEAYQFIKNNIQQAGGAQNQYQSIQGVQPPALYQPNNGGQQSNQPQAQPSGQPQGQPSGQQQTQTPGQQKQEPVSEISKPIPLTYPVRRAGEPFAAGPSEAQDKEVGVLYKNGLISRQPQMATERRNLDETIKIARQLEDSPWYEPTSGIAGAARRKLATWAGDPTYVELSKNLANTTLSNMQALGLKTDQDKQLSSAANGDYTYPPEVLIKIANRAKADMTNIDMQATAAKNFSDKFGDNNMNAFKQMWSKNADTKVFEVINVAKNPDLSAEEKKKEVDRLLGPENSPARKEYNQKYLNIMKMTQNGSL